MSGALINLVARGAQDAFLTGKPEVSFFKSTYKRHTNFAMFPVKLQTIGTAGTNSTVSIPIQRKGDLLSYVWADCKSGTISTVFGSNDNASPSVFRLYVGGQLVEEHDAFYASRLYSKFLANTGSKTTAARTATGANDVISSTVLPLHFSCCDDYGLSLPLVSLQYHDVEIRVNTYAGDGDADYYANYIQLDTEERKVLANEPREMLITQVQRIQKETNNKFDLSSLNHPVKCLMWGSANPTSPFDFAEAKISLNGVDMFDPMPNKYFSYIQTYHHTTNGSDLQAGTSADAKNLFMYSFALKADKAQPCGTCNYSRLDNSELKFSGALTNEGNLNWLYAVNFNIFRVQNGMGGLAFSN